MLDRLTPVSKRIDREAILHYARLSDDFNPLHVDPVFAATTPMQGVIAHGMLSLNLIWQTLRASLGDVGAHTNLDVRFVKPVRQDDVVTAGGTCTGAGRYEVWIKNQHDEIVISGTAEVRTPA